LKNKLNIPDQYLLTIKRDNFITNFEKERI
jgi:hypothetical protein